MALRFVFVSPSFFYFFFFFFFAILESTNVGLQGYVSPYVMDDGFEFKYSSPHQVLQEIWKIDEFSVGI
jgi:hypothetical protein